MASVPSTPIFENPTAPPPNRRLWSSPAFSQHSDYYSGDDGSTFSPESSTLKSSHLSFSQVAMKPESQNQRIILDRLSGIAKAILASPDLTEHHFHLIDQDVDRLEQTIAAPDPQSREPADIDDSGLFVDDEDDVTEVAAEQDDTLEVKWKPSQSNEAKEMVSRIVKVADDLNKRFEQTKRVNLAAETTIRSLTFDLSEQIAKNDLLYDEVSQYHTDFLYLKLSLKSLEVRVDTDMSPKIRAQFLQDIDRWKTQWKKSTECLRSRRMAGRTSQEPSVVDDDTSSIRSWGSTRRRVFMNGSPKLKGDSGTSSLTNGSPKSPRTPNKSHRPVTPQRYVSAPIISEVRDDDVDEPNLSLDQLKELSVPSLVSEEEPSQEETEELDTDEPVTDDMEEFEEPVVEVRKSAWEQLWDDLADFAGIHDPDD